jgi:hypothetical protein
MDQTDRAHHYRPSDPVVVGTDLGGSNGVGTARPGRQVAVKATGAYRDQDNFLWS